jgi:AcrR family transcriptional regulator
MTVTVSPDHLRRDARDNREAILEAARALFADSADVAMCQVARRAGVGQATLYRNFPSRGALAAEILDESVDRVAALAGEHAGQPDAFFVVLRGLIDSMVNLYGVAVLARRDAETDAHLQDSRQRIRELRSSRCPTPRRRGRCAATSRSTTPSCCWRWPAARWRASPTPANAPPSPTACWR